MYSNEDNLQNWTGNLLSPTSIRRAQVSPASNDYDPISINDVYINDISEPRVPNESYLNSFENIAGDVDHLRIADLRIDNFGYKTKNVICETGKDDLNIRGQTFKREFITMKDGQLQPTNGSLLNLERKYEIPNSVSDVHFKKFVNNLETSLMNREREHNANKIDNLPTSAIEFIKRNEKHRLKSERDAENSSDSSCYGPRPHPPASSRKQLTTSGRRVLGTLSGRRSVKRSNSSRSLKFCLPRSLSIGIPDKDKIKDILESGESSRLEMLSDSDQKINSSDLRSLRKPILKVKDSVGGDREGVVKPELGVNIHNKVTIVDPITPVDFSRPESIITQPPKLEDTTDGMDANTVGISSFNPLHRNIQPPSDIQALQLPRPAYNRSPSADSRTSHRSTVSNVSQMSMASKSTDTHNSCSNKKDNTYEELKRVQFMKQLEPRPEFSCEPETHPLTVCFDFPGTALTHLDVMDAVNFELSLCMTGSRGHVVRLEFLPRNVRLSCVWLENRWLVRLSDRVTEMSLLQHGRMTSLENRRPRATSGKHNNTKGKHAGDHGAPGSRKKAQKKKKKGQATCEEETNKAEEQVEPVKIFKYDNVLKDEYNYYLRNLRKKSNAVATKRDPTGQNNRPDTDASSCQEVDDQSSQEAEDSEEYYVTDSDDYSMTSYSGEEDTMMGNDQEEGGFDTQEGFKLDEDRVKIKFSHYDL